ncbi:hypothetical protein AAL_05625 [Moelleriella libera RCEF 2490]|uniref:Uncharacterized protein n=1 Tax=Moelleriella libera RCEF 2490 TaxID=1081109 RepID=A0A166NYC3_9HYPO|nr:hypothetical protein AAL_05625 [Moelleriella libera RCEF 2490]
MWFCVERKTWYSVLFLGYLVSLTFAIDPSSEPDDESFAIRQFLNLANRESSSTDYGAAPYDYSFLPPYQYATPTAASSSDLIISTWSTTETFPLTTVSSHWLSDRISTSYGVRPSYSLPDSSTRQKTETTSRLSSSDLGITASKTSVTSTPIERPSTVILTSIASEPPSSSYPSSISARSTGLSTVTRIFGSATSHSTAEVTRTRQVNSTVTRNVTLTVSVTSSIISFESSQLAITASLPSAPHNASQSVIFSVSVTTVSQTVTSVETLKSEPATAPETTTQSQTRNQTLSLSSHSFTNPSAISSTLRASNSTLSVPPIETVVTVTKTLVHGSNSTRFLSEFPTATTSPSLGINATSLYRSATASRGTQPGYQSSSAGIGSSLIPPWPTSSNSTPHRAETSGSPRAGSSILGTTVSSVRAGTTNLTSAPATRTVSKTITWSFSFPPYRNATYSRSATGSAPYYTHSPGNTSLHTSWLTGTVSEQSGSAASSGLGTLPTRRNSTNPPRTHSTYYSTSGPNSQTASPSLATLYNSSTHSFTASISRGNTSVRGGLSTGYSSSVDVQTRTATSILYLTTVETKTLKLTSITAPWLNSTTMASSSAARPVNYTSVWLDTATWPRSTSRILQSETNSHSNAANTSTQISVTRLWPTFYSATLGPSGSLTWSDRSQTHGSVLYPNTTTKSCTYGRGANMTTSTASLSRSGQVANSPRPSEWHRSTRCATHFSNTTTAAMTQCPTNPGCAASTASGAPGNTSANVTSMPTTFKTSVKSGQEMTEPPTSSQARPTNGATRIPPPVLPTVPDYPWGGGSPVHRHQSVADLIEGVGQDGRFWRRWKDEMVYRLRLALG